MGAQLISDPNYDISDPTDWLNTPLSCLASVEQALRCHVCKDFYTSPMITSCNHSFCSLCIRRCLSIDGKCPVCRKTDQESKLRGNWGLREAVEAFKQSRQAVLEYARKPASTAAMASPKRKASQLEDAENEVEQTPKKLQRSTRSTRSRGTAATVVIPEEDGDSTERSESADEYYPDDGLVACPICWQRMKEWEVDRHIGSGSCPGTPKTETQAAASAPTRSSRSNFLSAARPEPSQPRKPPEPLPSLNYSILKEQALRKKLNDLQIPSHGPKQLLERRHKEWVTIWNANCDSAHPKTRAELLRDLDVWERTIGSTIGSGTQQPASYGMQAPQPQVKDKNFDGASWAASHNSSFQDLIANARQSKRKAEHKVKEASTEGEARMAEGTPLTTNQNGSEGKQAESGFFRTASRYVGELDGFEERPLASLPITTDGAEPAGQAPSLPSR